MTNELRNGAFDMLDPMESFFGDFGKNFTNTSKMKTDVIENDKSFEVNAELPGFKKADIDIDYRNDTLSIHAVHDLNKDQKDKDGQLIRSERTSSNVSRAFYLPNVENDKISASYDGGILKINLPKEAKDKAKHEINID
ncbi:Hsp20/alpha crystallin family protein [Apilactobacillus timberlakei]|uniref:Hsp20/alpha crystallin family protein n=1 Tax=Apilactobacillus timberlakei TaxID=2008380 RepID=A0ABY2YV13_9LACO|nr:Hsp20/alpha crystallin family protein [Apilactobacillus timberlakei]TPR12933.1 Hsp20/alpha crystallin family protein [Apilactobacillus timberlakei]TPR14904.1 Hsp20/alpha crystallin family protein [Apilactobacillus timberlakei]TPR16235.1 Hsp20/alpha crystallin family protein [Apilactobacillus timberlakei]TPR16945.1 Hsp20/alpha crystallin family protein [Apilactobacillus timberlakei]TPR18598.1 Hsp20/alpha crystallin family protein [Apilactobacillus timberlakei]